MTVVKEISFCCGHRLMQHEGLCRNIHGHNYKVLLMVSGGIDTITGMVIDFSALKEKAEKIIKEKFDHALVLNEKDSLVSIFSSLEMERRTGYELKIVIMAWEPTAENMARHFLHLLPEIDGVRVYETDTSYAEEWRNK